VTLRPLPERSFPSFIADISRSTSLEAPRLYFLPELARLEVARFELVLRAPVLVEPDLLEPDRDRDVLELAQLAVLRVAMALPPSQLGRPFVVNWLST
jgi:hypothetical protein